METKKIVVSMVAILFAFVAFAQFAAADSFSLVCLGQGEQLDFGQLCNPAMPIVTGPTDICVKNYDNGAICPQIINKCNNLGLTCGSSANTTIDQDPPILQVNSPVNGSVYTQRSIPLEMQVNERSNVFYKDNNGVNSWRQVCIDCLSYGNSRSFVEGLNDLTFKAVDRNGNEAYLDISFRVDSRAPQITKTEPRNGFGSGEFLVEFKEDNPSNLIVHYGNSDTGFFDHEVDVNNECSLVGSKITCNTNIDLSAFDGEVIDYYAILTDVAGNIDQSQSRQISVDYSNPVVVSFDVGVDSRFATFNLEIDEANFDRVTYIDTNENRPRERNLCTRLVGDVCEKRVNFRDGTHNVLITIYDEAGNDVSFETNFFTDSKAPSITRTEPRRGFTSGYFTMQFREDNPLESFLHYGNSQTGMRTQEVNLDSCYLDRGRFNCDVFTDLGDYDGQEIEYYFTLTDLVGSEDQSRANSLVVDTVYPDVLSITHTIVSSNKAEIVIAVDEDNLDEIIYRNNDAPSLVDRRLCSRLESGGTCTKRITVYPGENSIDFQVYDEAGNSVGQNYQITL